MLTATVLLSLPILVALLSLAFLVPIMCKLYRRCGAEEITSEWLENFSPATYYPMQGLLAEEDFRFLSRQLLAHGQEDHSELVSRLIWLRVRFSLAVVYAEVSYLLCCLGFRALNARVVILRLEEMSAQLSSISAARFA